MSFRNFWTFTKCFTNYAPRWEKWDLRLLMYNRYIRVIDSRCYTFHERRLTIVLVAIWLRQMHRGEREMHAWPWLSLIDPGLAWSSLSLRAVQQPYIYPSSANLPELPGLPIRRIFTSSITRGELISQSLSSRVLPREDAKGGRGRNRTEEEIAPRTGKRDEAPCCMILLQGIPRDFSIYDDDNYVYWQVHRNQCNVRTSGDRCVTWTFTRVLRQTKVRCSVDWMYWPIETYRHSLGAIVRQH